MATETNILGSTSENQNHIQKHIWNRFNLNILQIAGDGKGDVFLSPFLLLLAI